MSARDGGTKVYKDSDGNAYYEDNRLETKTKGSLYNMYPGDKDACILDWENFEK